MEKDSEMDLVSVIVPVYNVEKYLRYCLDSICNQTYKNLEIILVNDASTDNSGKLCEEYARKELRIVCIHHKSNKGPSVARNHGVQKASGKYVAFVDGDDEIEYNMIEILHEAMKKYNVSVARCGAKRVSKLGGLKENGINKKIIKDELLEGWKYLLKYDKCSACCGMYETSLVKKMKFPVGLYYEDFFLIPRLLCKIEKVVYTGNAVCYHYYKRSGSTTEAAYKSGLNPDFSLTVLKNLEYFRKEYGERSFTFM
ncbi:MAG: glycosyltransferase family 2 protein, partial [Lachnospiraceae bacterium]|nr:glycosyltransferase family 2 protein [Lachnospiraceae bacterium]